MQLSIQEADLGTHPHKTLALRLWDAIAAGDTVEVGRLVSASAVWHVSGSSPVAGTYWGASGLLDLLGAMGELIEGSLELLDVYSSDDGAVLRYCIDARRGARGIIDEQVALLRIVQERVVEGVFAPLDQERFDRFLTG